MKKEKEKKVKEVEMEEGKEKQGRIHAREGENVGITEGERMLCRVGWTREVIRREGEVKCCQGENERRKKAGREGILSLEGR